MKSSLRMRCFAASAVIAGLGPVIADADTKLWSAPGNGAYPDSANWIGGTMADERKREGLRTEAGP